MGEIVCADAAAACAAACAAVAAAAAAWWLVPTTVVEFLRGIGEAFGATLVRKTKGRGES